MVDADLPDAAFDAVFVETDNRLIPYFITNLSVQNNRALLRLEDIDTLEQAQSLIGKSLYLPKTLRPKLGRGEFYDDEIVGFSVDDVTLGPLGTVKEITDAGPNKLIVVQHGEREVLIPVNGPFIQSIVKAKKSILVALPEGFLEI